MSKIDCSIILVNYNTCQLTLDCIYSIHKYSEGFTYEIIVVDNASTDGSKETLSKLESITFIDSGKNAGFGTANNLGLKRAVGDYLFLLNTDTILLENSIKKMLDFYKINQKQLKLGALGCILTDADGENINSGGIFPSVSYYLKAYLRRPIDEYQIHENMPFQKIDFVTGADLMISKNIYEEVGGFDENFFLYYEETDLQKRLFNLGYQNYILNSTKIIHLEGGSDSGEKVSNFKRTVIHKSRNRFLKKHDSSNFYKYALLDFFMSLVRFCHKDYSFAEKRFFFSENLKSYFK